MGIHSSIPDTPEVKELKRQLGDEEARTSFYKAWKDMAYKEVDQLKKDLEKYGNHLSRCITVDLKIRAYGYKEMPECNCGFEQVFNYTILDAIKSCSRCYEMFARLGIVFTPEQKKKIEKLSKLKQRKEILNILEREINDQNGKG